MGVDVVGDDDNDVAGNNLAPPDLGLAPEVAKFSDKLDLHQNSKNKTDIQFTTKYE